MSTQALFSAFKIEGISAAEKSVLIALADHANEQLECYPSQARLALFTGLSPKTVWRALQVLVKHGLISKHGRKRADGTRSTDVFTLLFVEPLVTMTIGKGSANRHGVQNQSSWCPQPVVTMTEQNLPIEPISSNLARARASEPVARAPRASLEELRARIRTGEFDA